MRKIISKQKQKELDRVKQIIVGSVLIIIMFASVLGYAFQGNDEESNSKIEYNGFEFIEKDNLWILEDSFMFKYNPKETEDFSFEGYVSLLSDFQNKPLYIYSEYKEAESEIYKNLYNSVQRIQYACLNESFNLNCEESWPTKTCEDNFILIKEGEFKVEQKDNCLFIQGPKENLTQISDEVLFKVLEIKS